MLSTVEKQVSQIGLRCEFPDETLFAPRSSYKRSNHQYSFTQLSVNPCASCGVGRSVVPASSVAMEVQRMEFIRLMAQRKTLEEARKTEGIS